MAQVARIIQTNITRINAIYRSGPSLYFYKRIRELREQHTLVGHFLSRDMCVEILYATLVSWDMNSRAAKMKDFSDFKQNLLDNLPAFQAVEHALAANNPAKAVESLLLLYDDLNLMKSYSNLVSNSKCLHFVFPSLCLPMDGANTLTKLYGNTSESRNKFRELIDFANDVLTATKNPKQYLDDGWNTCEMKLVDNAIILMKQ